MRKKIKDQCFLLCDRHQKFHVDISSLFLRRKRSDNYKVIKSLQFTKKNKLEKSRRQLLSQKATQLESLYATREVLSNESGRMWHQRKKVSFLKKRIMPKGAILGMVTELGILFKKVQRRNQIINEAVRSILLYKTEQGSFSSNEAKCHKLICPYYTWSMVCFGLHMVPWYSKIPFFLVPLFFFQLKLTELILLLC